MPRSPNLRLASFLLALTCGAASLHAADARTPQSASTPKGI